MLLVSALLFLLTLNFFGQPISPGLDASWKFAQNYFFSEGVRPGKDVIGTYGPLGFLANPMPVGSNMAIAFVFELLLRLSLVLVFVYLFLGHYPERAREKIIPAVVLLALIFSINRGEKTPGIELVALSLGLVFSAHKCEQKRGAFAAAAVFVTALALLIKFSVGVLCLSFLGLYCLREVKREKRLLPPALIIAGVLFLCAVFWLALYGDLRGLGDYFAGSMEQSRGYSSAMTSLNASDAPIWTVFGIMTLIPLYYAIRGDSHLVFLFLLFCPGLLIAYKYGVTKQPQFLFAYTFLTFFLLAGQAKGLARQISLLAITAVFLVFLQLNFGFLTADSFRFDASEPIFKPIALVSSLRQLFDFRCYEQELVKESASLLQPAKLGEESLAMIGGSPVDTYPFEISFIPANNLNWRPRPVFQSYFTYTPWLDRRNEAFFLSDRAPIYLLWDADRAESLSSIDGRYLLNDEPLAILQILGRYSYVREDRHAAIFERRGNSYIQKPVVFSASGPVDWNRWFAVPSINGGIVRARLRFSRTLLGRLRRTLYKESPVFVEYRFDSGETTRCRLVLDNAVSGIWVNPFVFSLLRPYSAGRVVAMRIANPDAKEGAFDPQFSVDWEFAGFNGPPPPYLLCARLP